MSPLPTDYDLNNFNLPDLSFREGAENTPHLKY